MPQSCFVIMPFHASFDSIYGIVEATVEKAGFNCIRSDFIRRPGKILDQIEEEIKRARFCIADLSRDPAHGNAINPNVLYEVGVAHATGKPAVLVTRDSTEELPFDLRQYTAVSYTEQGLRQFRSELGGWIKKIKDQREPGVDLLRQMLVPNSLGRSRPPFVVAASPLSYRTAFKSVGGWEQTPVTFSDYSGIRGLLQAFGFIFGTKALPELVNPDDYRKAVLQKSMHLYCIGSPKANRWSGWMMERFCESWKPEWKFGVDPESPDLLNPMVLLNINGKEHPSPVAGVRLRADYGLLIRGPYPKRTSRLFMMMGGRSALGTQAACMAATEPSCIAAVMKKLQAGGAQIDLDNHKSAFYATVSMKASIVPNKSRGSNQWRVRPQTFRVHEADLFHKRRVPRKRVKTRSRSRSRV